MQFAMSELFLFPIFLPKWKLLNLLDAYALGISDLQVALRVRVYKPNLFASYNFLSDQSYL